MADIVFKSLSGLAGYVSKRRAVHQENKAKKDKSDLPNAILLRYWYWHEPPIEVPTSDKVNAGLATVFSMVVTYWFLAFAIGLPLEIMTGFHGMLTALILTLGILIFLWRYGPGAYLSKATASQLRAESKHNRYMEVLYILWKKPFKTTFYLWKKGISPQDFGLMLSTVGVEPIDDLFWGPDSDFNR